MARVGQLVSVRKNLNWSVQERLIQVVKMARGNKSQRAFARELGVSATAVQHWERGDVIPETENLAKIGVRAGFTLEELLNYLDGEEHQSPRQLDQVLRHIQLMPLEQVAVVSRAIADRFASVAEKTKESQA